MELASKFCVKFSISPAKKKKRRGREGESTEKWGRKIMGLGKKLEVGEKELRCSISLVLHHAREGETEER
jgi:hypothetical protein